MASRQLNLDAIDVSRRLHPDAIDACIVTPRPRRRREVQAADRRRRQQPRRVGLLDSFQFLGAGVARAEDGRARRGFCRERRLVHAARVGLRGGAERARDAERVCGSRRGEEERGELAAHLCFLSRRRRFAALHFVRAVQIGHYAFYASRRALHVSYVINAQQCKTHDASMHADLCNWHSVKAVRAGCGD